eukprot:scaffold68115_cov70-Attheya_sp.AAC.5
METATLQSVCIGMGPMPKEISHIHQHQKSSHRGTTMDPRHHSRDMEIPEDPMDCSNRNSSRQGNSNQPSYQRHPIFPNDCLVMS